jgi:hypothetical protein
MALITLSEMLNEVQDEIAGKPQAKIVRALNKVIARLYKEPGVLIRGTFTTLAKVETGTVAVTNDSTTATFSSTVLTTSDPLDIVQIEGDSTWFTLTPSSTTVGALSSKWAQDTDATATYTLVRPAISFPAAIGEIIEVGRAGMEPLGFSNTEYDGAFPSWTRTGTPTAWMPYKYDSAAATPNDDLLRIVLIPFPEEMIVYSYTARPRPTRISITATPSSTTIPLSDVWYEAIVEGTLYFAWLQEDKAVAQFHFQLYEEALKRIRSQLMPSARIVPRPRMTGRVRRYTTDVPTYG